MFFFLFQNGFTPLHIAAKYGNLNIAGVLIQHGATIDYKTKVHNLKDAPHSRGLHGPAFA